MSNIGQTVAALSGGALLAIVVMQGIRLETLRRKDDRQREAQELREAEQRRIDTAVRAVLGGVEAARQHHPGAAIEVRAKAHLRMLVPPQPCPDQRAGRDTAPVRARRSQRARDR